MQTASEPSSSVLSWDNEITVYKNGDQVDQIHNTLTDQGRQVIAGKLFNDTSSTAEPPGGEFKYVGNQNVTFIALANATNPSQTGDASFFDGVEPGDTVLDTEIGRSVALKAFNLSRNTTTQISSQTAAGVSYQLEKSYTYSGNGFAGTPPAIRVNGTGLYFDGEDQSLVSGGGFTGATLKPGDTITVTHDITISDGS